MLAWQGANRETYGEVFTGAAGAGLDGWKVVIGKGRIDKLEVAVGKELDIHHISHLPVGH